ncbi:MAG: CHAD domain-containing protein [Solirubrobacteraceae bacterium]|nr:CHAD domain-containing protein [Solirubrobacteraceae bacterium]
MTPDTAPIGVEIERKFLVTRVPDDLERHPSQRLEQGYLAVDPDGAVVRLRRSGINRILTIKAGHGVERAEEELQLDAPRFARLWPLTAGRRVEKVRYRIPAGELTIELDVYEGELEGLVTAEVEAHSLAAVRAFVPEPWMRLEISGDPRYGNASLAVHGVPVRPVSGEHGLFDGEEAGAGIVQVALGEIDLAATALRGGQEPAKAVHTSRKTFKRLRAIIRVAKGGLGDEVATRDNAALRDAGRRLAGARDAKVVVDTLDGLLARAPDQLDALALAPLRDLLVADRAEAEALAAHDEGAIEAVLAELATVRGDISRWDLGSDASVVLAAGFERIHRKGRKALKTAEHSTGEPRTEAMHDLRKRAKDLWHAAELLEAAAPRRLATMAARAHDLADLIGDDHDLAVLAERADERSGRLPASLPLDALHAVIDRRRRKLQRKALRLAGELYGDDPSPLVVSVQELPATKVA